MKRLFLLMVGLAWLLASGLPMAAAADPQRPHKARRHTTVHRATAHRKTTHHRKTSYRRPTGKRRYATTRRRSRRGYARVNPWLKPRTAYAPPDSAFRAAHPELPADFQPSFMKAELNQILTFGNDDPLRTFRQAAQKLTTGENRQLRILHLGDSHLQADILSGRMRELWQEPAQGGYGAAGRGLIFPYALAHTNNPYDYRVTYTGTWLPRRSAISNHHTNWGLAGLAAATATAGATFTVQLVGVTAARSPITKVRVFYTLDDSTSFHLELADSANIAAYQPNPAGGYADWTLRAPVTGLTFRIRQTRPGQSRLILQGLNLENAQPGVIYGTAGGNGATVDSYLRCGRLKRHMASLAPDLVILSLGTNDVFGGYFDSTAFRRSYATLLQLIQRAAPGASILLTTPGDTFRNGKPNDARTSAAARVIRQLAEETGCAVWDFYAVMGGPKSITDWANVGLAQRDYVHYTTRGYTLQGDLLNVALRAAINQPGGPTAPVPLPADPK